MSLALLGTSALWAEDAAPDQKKPTETKSGVLSEKPGTAGEGVVAILTVKAERKAAKHGGGGATEEKINLIAQGDLATKIVDLAKKGATVDATGVLDGAAMKVTEVVEKAAGGDATTAKHHKKNKTP